MCQLRPNAGDLDGHIQFRCVTVAFPLCSFNAIERGLSFGDPFMLVLVCQKTIANSHRFPIPATIAKSIPRQGTDVRRILDQVTRFCPECPAKVKWVDLVHNSHTACKCQDHNAGYLCADCNTDGIRLHIQSVRQCLAERDKGNRLFKSGDFAGACDHYAKAIASAEEAERIFPNTITLTAEGQGVPLKAVCYNNSATAYLQLLPTEPEHARDSTINTATTLCQIAIATCPDWFKPLLTMARIARACHMFDDAYKHLNRASNVCPDQHKKVIDEEVVKVQNDQHRHLGLPYVVLDNGDLMISQAGVGAEKQAEGRAEGREGRESRGQEQRAKEQQEGRERQEWRNREENVADDNGGGNSGSDYSEDGNIGCEPIVLCRMRGISMV